MLTGEQTIDNDATKFEMTDLVPSPAGRPNRRSHAAMGREFVRRRDESRAT